MRFGEKSENFFEKFLLPLPTGGQIPVWPKTFESFFLHFPPDTGSAFGSQISEFFFPLLLFGDGRCVLTKKIIFLYEISSALVYMGEMSTPTTHWRCGLRLNRELEIFLSSLTTADESAVWEKKYRRFFIPLPISEKSIRIEPPFRSK